MNYLSAGERVIIETRYGGTYEGGLWAAFASPQIPAEAQGDDLECGGWWTAPTVAAGAGQSPAQALEMLEEVVRACKHPKPSRNPVPAGFTCGFCNQLIRPSAGPVEDLLAVVTRWSSLLPLNLWVPTELTFRGEPIDNDAAIAIVSDAILALGLTPRGTTDDDGGRTLWCTPS